jgi:hypothetical protein
MRHFALVLVILIALLPSNRALAQTPAVDLQRAVEGARTQRQAGIILTFVGVGFSTLGTALVLSGALTAGEASGPWSGMLLSGMILAPFGATLGATGIPLWATARVKF